MTSDTATPPTQSTPTVDAEGAALASRNRMALILLLAAVFVVFLNETMMNVALPKIQEALEAERGLGENQAGARTEGETRVKRGAR